ncbi:hypothetical protein VP01_685g4 [Puccinia sorghi]|uniref:Uncharacterized protein n=1 Tax=Puccinia sorghi TaxID=27349 RepID=A0A0L6UF77_9BASI|nr:hypothetical protein VP01_685g4 [Puccinia sorghi]
MLKSTTTSGHVILFYFFNADRALIFSSVSYTVVTLSSLCLTMWGSMAPDVVLKGGHMRIRFISSLLVLFAFYGLSINLGILYQAWSTVHPRTTSSHNISTPPRLPPSMNAFFSCNNKLLRLLPSRNPPNITSGKSPPHKT